MSYATKQDMIDRHGEDALIELTDRGNPSTGEINDNVLNLALSDADGIINSFIQARYDLPLAVVPPALVRYACLIAFYTLHRGRHTEETRKDFEDAIGFLKMVAKGDASLDAGGTQPPTAPAEARVEGPDRMFSRDELKVY